METPIRVFIRMVLPDGRVVDAIGSSEQAEMEKVSDDLLAFSRRRVRTISRHCPAWLLRFLPGDIEIEGWRISEFDAAINWETRGPEHLPSAEQLILGRARDSQDL
jgi:hypothetical protein